MNKCYNTIRWKIIVKVNHVTIRYYNLYNFMLAIGGIIIYLIWTEDY